MSRRHGEAVAVMHRRRSPECGNGHRLRRGEVKAPGAVENAQSVRVTSVYTVPGA